MLERVKIKNDEGKCVVPADSYQTNNQDEKPYANRFMGIRSDIPIRKWYLKINDLTVKKALSSMLK